MVGERIRQLRIHKQLTQKELTEGICSITYLSRIENGQINPSAEFLRKVSKRLGYDLTELSSPNRDEKTWRIVENYKQNGEITEEELSYLHIQTLELNSTKINLDICGVLLKYYTTKGEIEQARSIYNLSKRFISGDMSVELEEEYFYYFLACGNFFYYLQDFTLANHYYSKGESLLLDKENLEAAKLYYNLSLVKQRTYANQEVSLYYSQKAYEIFKKYGEKENIIIVLITLGVQYQLNNELDTSMECLKKAEAIIVKEKEREKYVSYTAMIQHNMGRIYEKKKDYHGAVSYYIKSMEKFERYSLEQQNVYPLKRLVEIYIELKDWVLVDKYLERAIAITEKHQLKYDCIRLNMIKLSVKKIQGNEGSYEKGMQKLLDTAIQLNQGALIKKITKELGNHFYEKKAYKKAADFLIRALDYEE
ncbi:anaerobic benzoate catabolism transcriptional regulator [Mycobacteroides abscessus subsp. abscessus]|nr:anaerobic benzoate catabolism transcriptional regulator [Mycobacteroides abscessus subsp. abscessus]HEO8418234.1 helix-turn-helix transcriptional regulator [Yersinia enterocolitica]